MLSNNALERTVEQSGVGLATAGPSCPAAQLGRLAASGSSVANSYTSWEGVMRTTHWLVALMLGLLLAACVGMNTAPTPEVRQALAPTGKLRVGLLLGDSTQAMKDPVS